MEWMNRAARSAQSTNQTASPQSSGTSARNSGQNPSSNKLNKTDIFSIRHLPFAILLVSVTIIITAVVALTILVKDKSEARFVDKSKLQAVFLNGGQVYFGRIGSLNDSYIRMGDIYYLRVNQQVQPGESQATQQQDISLVKLGCELHGPEDQMLINREQVVFWENLKPDGQVTKAVEEYVKGNPNGQNCETDQQQATTPQATPGNENQNNSEDTEEQPQNP